MTKLLQQCFLFFIGVVIPGHNLGNSQVSVNRTIGPTLVFNYLPLQIWTLKICIHDISKIITARSFKLGQLIEDDE